MFSVSSGYQNSQISITYLKAANVARLYFDKQEGEMDKLVQQEFSNLTYHDENDRYGYYDIPLSNPSYAQAVDLSKAEDTKSLEPGCRVIFQETYCGSVGEEFVTEDFEETRYMESYVSLLEEPYFSSASYKMINPDNYQISVTNATENTSVVVKMTYDSDFEASINGKVIPIKTIGPDFMLITPSIKGDYVINLKYKISKIILIGAGVSILSLLITIIYFIINPFKNFSRKIKRGDM